MPNMPNFSSATWSVMGIILITITCAFPVLVLVYGLLLSRDTRRYTMEPTVRRRGRVVLGLCLSGVLLAFSSGLWLRQMGAAAVIFYSLLELMLISALVLTAWFLRQPLRRTLRLVTGALLTGGMLLAFCLPLLPVIADFAQKGAAYSNFNEAEVRAALQRNPKDAAAHSSLAQIEAQHRNHAGAMAEWRQVLALEPDNEFALYMLGSELTRARQPEQARPFYQKLASGNGAFRDSAQKWLAHHGG